MIGEALKLGFVLASDAPIGAVLLLAIARLTGAEWGVLARIAAPLPIVAVLALVFAVPAAHLPEHLRLWQASPFVAVRAVAVTVALAWAGLRLARGASRTFAGVVLALYAWLVTPIGHDWLMAGEPGHQVSAVGMMLAVQQIGAACAVALVLGIGGERVRGDWAKLMIAAALGLCYLAYMDYLIVWFGNLPSRVPFYVDRATWPAAIAVPVAMLLGLFAPIALLWLRPGETGRYWAGVIALVGLVVFDAWWIAGPAETAVALILPVLVYGFARYRERAHG